MERTLLVVDVNMLNCFLLNVEWLCRCLCPAALVSRPPASLMLNTIICREPQVGYSVFTLGNGSWAHAAFCTIIANRNSCGSNVVLINWVFCRFYYGLILEKGAR